MTSDDLAVVAATATELEAHTKATVLKSSGIEAAVSRTAPSWTGQLPINPSPLGRGAVVLVRRDDLEKARSVLEEAVEDSQEVDWENVDVGERDDQLPLRPVNRVPPLAKIGTIVAWAMLILAGLAALLMTML